MDPIVLCLSLCYCFQYPYCPLDTLFLLFTFLLSVPLFVLDLDSLLFSLGHSHAIVLFKTIALSCVSSVSCMP